MSQNFETCLLEIIDYSVTTHINCLIRHLLIMKSFNRIVSTLRAETELDINNGMFRLAQIWRTLYFVDLVFFIYNVLKL
jgi:hypothetical protein